ncbi:MAG TPA: hypothetical protein VFO83_12240 [Aggregicoccus sp.]|nr:hypothetical protein [Aggregicoccus sp.]
MSKAAGWAVVLALGLGAAGCGGGKSYALRPLERTSGAEGKLKVKEVDNGNRLVSVEMEHLAQPSAIQGSFTTYVLWLRPAQQKEWKNMGALRIDSDRKAKLETVTPYESFDVMVTAEAEATGNEPKGVPVLTGGPN